MEEYQPHLYLYEGSEYMAIKMLKPDRWHALFDSEGRVLGFHKVLKLICMGGVDPSIRAEVWEFLLGCYALSSTVDFRVKLRAARRKRYKELVKECQKMHNSIGTGMLAFVVGSKVMDMRGYSKKDPEVKALETSEAHSGRITECENNNGVCQTERSSHSSDNVSVRESVDAHQSDSTVENQSDCPSLLATNLSHNNSEAEKECELHDSRQRLDDDDESMHSSQIRNNEDLITGSNGSFSNSSPDSFNSDKDVDHIHGEEMVLQFNKLSPNSDLVNNYRISKPETARMVASTSMGEHGGDRVSEWLWTLHSIVVDVVRTDNHLEFYEDKKNLARMSDMLAIYAWIDPQTGYCQGMSDLLSPFLVLFEDDSDAFWCFEMLLRRVRDNFRMEGGSSGVMQQLVTLWRILELTDREMFSHLSHIGAEGLHFAFRMLHVLFRRELSFSDALCLWEMMWATDFDASMANLEENCLERLMIRIPRESYGDIEVENMEFDEALKDIAERKHHSAELFMSGIIRRKSVGSFCGLTQSFWPRSSNMHSCDIAFSRDVENDLPVFCAAAILILNRHKIIKEARSMDDLIKIFNDNMLTIRVRKCISMAVKLRKKYFYKMVVKKSKIGRSVSVG